MVNNNFNPSQRNTIWEKYYKKRYAAIDIFGRPMTKDNFEVDHILPAAKEGKTIVENGIPLTALSNEEKSDKCSGIINGHSFEVKENSSGIGQLIVDGNIISK